MERIHPHSLTFKEKKNDGPLQFCKGCMEPVFGPHYTCDTCDQWYSSNAGKFVIHKSCAQLPLEIHHPIHPKHPLILGKDLYSTCGVCNCSQIERRAYILSYRCFECNFSIDVKCASSWPNVGHEHNFTILRKPIKFTCDVCGLGDGYFKQNFYLCNICQLLVHGKCSWLPLQVKIARHQHCLKLTWWFQEKYPKDPDLCAICSEKMDGNRAMYCCHDNECSCAAHCKCIRTEAKIMNVLVVDHDDDEPSTSRRPPTDQTAADDIPLQIKHFSHQHMLTLIDGEEVARQDDQDEGINCKGCTLPIIRGESYRSCTEQEIEKPCNFSLHINCAKLPGTWLLPLHKHELTLLPITSFVGGVFKCDMCKSLSQGFSYHCQDCYFNLDLCCSILYEHKSFRCDAHVHPLQFSRNLVSCSSCGTCDQDFCFRCSRKKCDFHLCIPCVKLPLTVRYKYDDHPLKLTYTSVKNDLNEYYCDICEGKRDPKHWFYSCPDCDCDCHPHCIRGRYPQVKLGGSYKHGDHQHNVALVHKRKSEIPNDKREHLLPCPDCFYICEGLVCECLECGINIHREHEWLHEDDARKKYGDNNSARWRQGKTDRELLVPKHV